MLGLKEIEIEKKEDKEMVDDKGGHDRRQRRTEQGEERVTEKSGEKETPKLKGRKLLCM